MLYVIICGIIMAAILVGSVVIQAKLLPDPVPCTGEELKGELVDICEGGPGLSRVTVMDDNGRLVYGFSNLPVEDLRQLAGRDGQIRIQLAKPPEDEGTKEAGK